MKRLPLLVISGLLAVTGCSSGGGKAGIDYKSAESIASALDTGGFACARYEQNKEVIGAREDGSCEHGDASIGVTVYNSKDQKESIKKAFAAFLSGISVEGDTWAVSGLDTKADAEKVQAIVGGKIS